ncbi:MAG: hypothetical protein E7173_02725 [Firmicutes bacterium]|nr:hypothetical protein [Bacillota bacterium]
MLLDFCKEQEIAYNMIQNIVKKGNLSHAYLIETNNYRGGLDFALAFAKTILCPKNNLRKENCGGCTQCEKIANNSFSELEIIEPDGIWIKKEQLDKLQKKFSTKSLESGKKVYIINHTEKLNVSAANSILKFLEEPEDNIVAILLVDNTYSLLDTIISRCHIIKLNNCCNFHNELTTIEKVSNYLFNNLEEINKFVEQSKESNYIADILNIIKKLESTGIELILEENKIFSTFLRDKSDFSNFLDIVILYYKDVLDYKLSQKITVFNDSKEHVVSVSEINTINQIIRKIEILTKTKERIKYNCNLNLILDKLIILFGGV